VWVIIKRQLQRRFVDDEHQDQFKKDFGVTQLAEIFAVMAILISCLGLFGLASFLVEKRTKEISIRKVLGASAGNLWLSLSTEMLKPVILGFVVAAPLAALAISPLLSLSEYHIPLSWWIFALAGAAVFLIALATVSYHGFRAARINPHERCRRSNRPNLNDRKTLTWLTKYIRAAVD
jgi:putative ABC transport system permease protein